MQSVRGRLLAALSEFCREERRHPSGLEGCRRKPDGV